MGRLQITSRFKGGTELKNLWHFNHKKSFSSVTKICSSFICEFKTFLNCVRSRSLSHPPMLRHWVKTRGKPLGGKRFQRAFSRTYQDSNSGAYSPPFVIFFQFAKGFFKKNPKFSPPYNFWIRPCSNLWTFIEQIHNKIFWHILHQKIFKNSKLLHKMLPVENDFFYLVVFPLDLATNTTNHYYAINSMGIISE